MANRLASATSPYLLQHAENPVDWWEWGPEAFAEARRRDVPIFLSVGYSACHWCHVMAHESFEDEATAEQLNADYVSVKVDREERPDVDAVYMGATQAMTGQGGWPMTVILTPDGQPFFAGTYFPPQPRHGMPAFRQVLAAISEAWRDRREEVEKAGADITGHLQVMARSSDQPDRTLDAEAISASAVKALSRSFDNIHGGFGGAPKFPPSMILEFLLRRAARLGDPEALAMAECTLEAMARGGIYDQLGGGFARYSVDGSWQVPHFEKMLYDNALLLRVYMHWWRLTGSELAERVARGTADFMIRELLTDQGGFASALDADSDGREGAFYVWTPAELRAVVGDEAGTRAASLFSVTEKGNAEGGESTLMLLSDPDDGAEYRAMVDALLEARGRRPRPARDDKVVSAWNGLAITALAESGVLLQEMRYLDAAQRAATLLLEVHLADGQTIRRASRDGVVGEPAGVLEDYSCVAEGFLTLFSATGEVEWYDHARKLVEQLDERFNDGEGGYFDTASDAEALVVRPRDATDNATPSGHATTSAVLVSMFGFTGDTRYREQAEDLLRRTSAMMQREPRFAGKSLEVLEALADGPRQLAIVGPDGDESRQALLRSGFRLLHPGLVIAQGSGTSAAVPLLWDRGLVDGRSAAYLCHDFVCDLPVTDPARLGAEPMQ